MSRPVVLDTSVLIGAEQGRALARPIPGDVAVSVVTLAELEVGVLVARDGKSRAQRLATLTGVRQATVGLPADERVGAEVWTQDADFTAFAGVDVVRV